MIFCSFIFDSCQTRRHQSLFLSCDTTAVSERARQAHQKSINGSRATGKKSPENRFPSNPDGSAFFRRPKAASMASPKAPPVTAFRPNEPVSPSAGALPSLDMRESAATKATPSQESPRAAPRLSQWLPPRAHHSCHRPRQRTECLTQQATRTTSRGPERPVSPTSCRGFRNQRDK